MSEFILESGRAVGAKTVDGREYTASKAVISSLHFNLLPTLVPGYSFPPEFLKGISNWESGPSLFVVHLAVDQNPFVRSRNSSLPSVLTGSITPDGLRKQLNDVESGVASTHEGLWLLAACSTIVDPSRAPNGKGVIKIMTMAPYALNGDPKNWEAYKDEYADFLIRLYAKLIINYTPNSELGRSIASPFDIELTNPNFFGGNSQGGHTIPTQAGINRPVAGWASYRSPVPDLFQTGLCTHPGGAVTGWPGRNCARAVLADIGMDADKIIPPV